MRLKSVVFAWLAVLMTTSFMAAAPAHAEKSLYDRLGGKVAIKLVVTDLVKRAYDDPRIHKFFVPTASDKARLDKFEGLLVDWVCWKTGGPCKYTGKNMKDTHKDMGLTKADFSALVDDLKKSLTKYGVHQKEQDELVAIINSKEGVVVTK